MTVVTTTMKNTKSGNNLLIILIVLFIMLFAGAMLITHNKHSTVDFIHNNCSDNSFFASASDGEGNYAEFCLMNDGRIGVIYRRANGSIDGEIVEYKEYRLIDIIDHIHKLGSNWRLVWFKNINGVFHP